MLLNLIFIIILLALGILGYAVIHRHFKVKINILFFIFIAVGIFWLLFNYLENFPFELEWKVFFLKLDFFFGPWLTYFFLIFALNFPQKRQDKHLCMLLALPPLFFSCLSIGTSYIINNIGLDNNNLNFNFGPLFFADVIFTLLYFGAGFLKWAIDLASFSGVKKNQLLFVFWGTLITSLILLFANLFLQKVIATPLYRLVPLSVVFFIFFTCYAIIRHRLFDIRIFIQKSILYFIALGLFYSFYLGIFFVMDKIFSLMALKNEISTLILAGSIIIFYPKFKHIFLKKTDRFFYRFPYDHREVLKMINAACHLKVEYVDYFNSLEEIMEKKIRINKFLLVVMKGNKIYRIYNHNFSRKLIKFLKALNTVPPELINYFSKHKQKALATHNDRELEAIIEGREFFKETIAKFIKFDLHLFLPIYNKNIFSGFIFLGPKMSGEAYYPQDLRLFDELIDRISLAFENIELYQEIKRHTRTLETKIKERTEELNLQHENQIRFTADISHELQTPLAILKGNLSLISQNKIDSQEVNKGYARMERSVDRLSNIIKDLIFLTKADSGKIQIEKREFNLSQTIRSVYDDSYILAEDKHINFRLEILGDIIIMADEEKIKSLMFNLISNALKFTPAGKKIKISLSEFSSSAYIIVEDEGLGITDKDQPNIFSRFYRIDNPDNPKGSGLGLAICKWIVNAHGGEISVKSVLGQGSIFKVILPLAGKK